LGIGIWRTLVRLAFGGVPHYFSRIMAEIAPFAAVRPKPQLAGRICQLPYDVMSSSEARALAHGNPVSFLRVSKPEIELPENTDPYSPQVYAKGREVFARLLAEGALVRDAQPAFYFYRQIMGNHRQTGLVAAASCQDYMRGIIKKHELTRPEKEDDRVRHIEALNAQTGPAFLVYPASRRMDDLAASSTDGTPDIDFVADDGVRHTSWTVRDAAVTAALRAAFAEMPCLYIADGHHRSAAAGRVFQSRKGAGGSGYFLSVIFPHNQTQILPYNRVLKDLNGLSNSQLLKKLEAVFAVSAGGPPQPGSKHELGLYLQERWHTLRFRPELTAGRTGIEGLDVTLLQETVLRPLFGIDDPRTSQRINFVGGIRGTSELEKLVKSGDYACSFSLFPTSVEDLMAVADAGGIMPPKSTWFEPKLRDGMFCHVI
jgi:uncharacterized protein (DUF1015 family)